MVIRADITGNEYGSLTVLEPLPLEKGKARSWQCACLCGGTHVATKGNLEAGSVTNCGCLKRERNSKLFYKHGKRFTNEWYAWQSMKKRCTATNGNEKRNYVDRGITVYSGWVDDFQAFYDHVGPRPGAGYSLDRINNDGNYEPGNVRWATRKTQNLNKTTTLTECVNGCVLPIAVWAERLSIQPNTLKQRLRKWTVPEAFSTPIGKPRGVYLLTPDKANALAVAPDFFLVPR